MNKLRILVLAPDANPDSISTALVGYAHSEALARRHTVTLVVRSGGDEAAVRRVGAPFHRVVGIRVPGMDEFYAWSLRRIFKYDYGSHALTAFNYPFMVAFEWCAWREMRAAIRAGEFDVVLRVLPVTSVLPSAFAFLLRKGPIPMVLGPLNGGLPWPPGFVQAEKQKEWISGLRNFYQVLPFSRSMFRHAKAIIGGSSQTCQEFDAYRDKLFFVPENGINPTKLGTTTRQPGSGVLRLIFVGRLVPYKACDLALRAAAPLVRAGRATFDVIGDGAERGALEQLSRELAIDGKVRFSGWLTHADVLDRMRSADVLVFPSIREFGGGNIFEALAMGVVPIVVAFGGPGDIVSPAVGYRVSLTNPDDVVAQIKQALEELDRDRAHLGRLSDAGMQYARQHLTWDGKADAMTRILTWAAGYGPKPDFPPPSRVRPSQVLLNQPSA
jgi:glycosyltransferase involved in cell wall biosynthesis